MNILSFGLDRAIFNKKSDSFWRARQYASWFSKYVMVVTTLKKDGFRQLELGNFLVIPTNSAHRLFYPLDALKIALRTRANNYHLISVQDPFITAIGGILIKFFLKLPLNIQIHSEFFNSRYYRQENLFNRILYHVGLTTLRFADTVRARNDRIARDVEKRFPRLKKRSFYVGAPINPIHLQPLNKKANRDKFLVISVGRPAKQKNFPLLIEAFKLVKEKIPRVRLKLVGFYGDHKSARQLKNLYEKSGVFVLASNHEGWGLVVLEALARGCPVVMTDTGCAGQIVIDGKTGYVAPVGDAKKLADKIVVAINNHQKSLTMAKRGREAVLIDSDLNLIRKSLARMFNATTTHA